MSATSAGGSCGTPLAAELGLRPGMAAAWLEVLAERLPALREAIRPAGMAWIAWPKRASRVPTTVTEDVVGSWRCRSAWST
ncbi:MAG: hypothetical protein AVDCRST_MAG13-999 [uncultured Solirubrobacteraceae bacterium]|uniref:Uncharacterized protein n=1 Tax=uncultured Solirubrobacteraceae bacterium TaxID=1162706 RepID=A0A6J4RXG8_9ACTN|nr:MAG: hypothetical protein AVDCRST_MAG13-999 [uncultured Solirubrobacteraceae bacterium]